MDVVRPLMPPLMVLEGQKALVQRLGDQSQGGDLMDTQDVSKKNHGKMVWYSLPTWTTHINGGIFTKKLTLSTFGRVLNNSTVSRWFSPNWTWGNPLISLILFPNLWYLFVGYPETQGVSNNFKILPPGGMIQSETYFFSAILIPTFWWVRWSSPFRSIFSQAINYPHIKDANSVVAHY